MITVRILLGVGKDSGGLIRDAVVGTGGNLPGEGVGGDSGGSGRGLGRRVTG